MSDQQRENTIVRFDGIRVDYNALFTPDPKNGRYKATFIVEQTHPAITGFNQGIVAEAQKAWGAQAQATVSALHAQGKLGLKDGARKLGREDYIGRLYLNAGNSVAPIVINPDGSVMKTLNPAVLYAGTQCNAIFELSCYTHKEHGPLLSIKLLGIQPYGTGDRIKGGGSRTASQSDFAPIPGAAASGGAAANVFGQAFGQPTQVPGGAPAQAPFTPPAQPAPMFPGATTTTSPSNPLQNFF